MLNQPKPAPKIVEKVAKGKSSEDEAAAAEKAKPKVNREKESFVEREARRAAGTATRAEVRAKVEREVAGSGIFAAITASGGEDVGASHVDDLLGGASAGLSSIGSMAIGKGAFVTRSTGGKGGGEGMAERTGGRVGDVGIERQGVGRAGGAQFGTSGSVNITTQAPPEISGAGANASERSQEAIGHVITREQSRLKRVYEEWLKRDPQISGRLTVKFSLMPDGSVANLTIANSTIANTDFCDAILRYVKRWQFASVAGGGPVEVTVPFNFGSQG